MLRRVFWILLAAALLLASYISTAAGMTGGWDIHVFGVAHGSVWDPAGQYLPSGLLLFEQPRAVFVGHPGLTLMVVCNAVGKLLYFASQSRLPFDDYAGRHIYSIEFATMLTMTALFLLALAELERVALVVLGDAKLAAIAVLAFATSYPVLYYINRISPEPLLILFTLLAFRWLWRYYELGESRKAFVYLGLSAQAAVLAFYTKLLIVGPILAYIPLQLAFRRGVPRRRALRDAALYCAFLIPGMVIGSWKMDWPAFFQLWFAYSPAHPTYVASHSWAMNVATNTAGTAAAMIGSSVSNLFSRDVIPSFSTRPGQFFAAEDVFLVVAAIGLWLYWRARANRPVLLGWFLGFTALILIPCLQRGFNGWHYLHIELAVASIFFSYGLARGARALGLSASTTRGWAICCAATIAVHGLAIAMYVDLERYNASQYPAWEWYYRAPATVADDARVGLVDTMAIPEITQPVFASGPEAFMKGAFTSTLVPIASNATADELKRRRIAMVLTLAGGRLTPSPVR